MDKDTVRAFVRWLDKASLAEINARQDLLERVAPEIRTPEGRADLALARRLMDEELLARCGLAAAERR